MNLTTNNAYVLPVKLRMLEFTAATQNLCYTYLHITPTHKSLIINLCSYTYTCGMVDTRESITLMYTYCIA